MKAYRERQEQARRLADQGFLIAEIAARLDTDVEAVRGWLRL